MAQKKTNQRQKETLKKTRKTQQAMRKKRQTTIEKTHNVGKQHEKHQLAQKC